MMTTRRLLFILLACSLALGGLIASAEAQRASRGLRSLKRGEQVGARLQARLQGNLATCPPFLAALELTEEQKAQLQTLREQHREQMQALREQVQSGTLEPSAAREQMQALREKFFQELKEILTEEQLQKLEELKAKRPRWGCGGPSSAEDGDEGVATGTAKAAGAAIESSTWGKIKEQAK